MHMPISRVEAMWGASIEGVNPQGTGLELLYQYQSTDVPAYTYTR